VKTKPNASAIAFSYLRFSSPAQAEGDTVRRQSTLLDAWLKSNPHVRLDTSLTLVDAGVSGFTGKHRTNKKHALATFFDLVERGRVPAGSYLVVENLDRLTREKPIDAIPAALGLIKAGVKIQQLAPLTTYDSEMQLSNLLMMMLELSRGHGESKRKSDTLGEVWGAKKKAARETRKPYGRMCPAWLELVDGKYRAKADAAKTVRKIFQWCADGLGAYGILGKLAEEEIPPIGHRGKPWERSYVKKLLNSVSVLGIYQPHKGSRGPNRKADGEPISDFYPRVVSDELWHKAHEAIKSRKRCSGRPAVKSNNPFSGLLHCAIDQCPIHVQGTNGPNFKYLVSHAALMKRKGAKWRAFPLDVFRTQVLDELEELKGAELFADPGAAKLVALTKDLADVERRLSNATARFEADPESQQWQNLVSKYDREKRAIVKERAEEQQRSANPLSAAWVEAVELMARDEPDRLRAALLSVVDGVWCVFAGSAMRKVAAVQVWFKGGSHREYAIHYRVRYGSDNKTRTPEVATRTFRDFGLPSGWDLRQPGDVTQLEAALTRALAENVAKRETGRKRKPPRVVQ